MATQAVLRRCPRGSCPPMFARFRRNDFEIRTNDARALPGRLSVVQYIKKIDLGHSTHDLLGDAPGVKAVPRGSR